MDFLSILSTIFLFILGYILLQVIRLLLADGDLTLMFAEKFGKNASCLNGKVIWITGASGGIGEYLAYELAKHGAKLILSARRVNELERVKAQIIEKFSNVKKEDIFVMEMDMLKFNEYSACYSKVLNYFSQVDMLIHNAGRSQRAAWDKIDIDVDHQMFDLNVFGPVYLTRLVLPEMEERKSGHIVVISSLAGKLGAPFSCTYTGTKFAVNGYFEALRIEKLCIDVSVICPGPIMSEVVQNAYAENVNQGYSAAEGEGHEKKRMTTQRCAHLITVAIANKLDEAWICRMPLLLSFYFYQWMPTTARRLTKMFGHKVMQKVRAGE